MRVIVVHEHVDCGEFPTFAKGTPVIITGEADTHFAHWFPCEIDGYETYIPKNFIADGVLARDYNPTELTQRVGSVLEVCEIAHAWLFAKSKSGKTGWIPAESVVSV